MKRKNSISLETLKLERAFSLTEMLIALSISGVMLLSAFYFLSKNLRGLSSENDQAHLESQFQSLQQTIKADLQNAPRLTGTSSESLPSISNQDINGNGFIVFQVIREVESGFQLPISKLDEVGSHLEISIQTLETDPQIQKLSFERAYDFLSDRTNTLPQPYILISDAGTKNMFQATEVRLEANKIKIKIDPSSPGISSITNMARLSFAERVTYWVNEDSELLRQTSFSSQARVLMKSVSDFQVRFEFNRASNTSALLPTYPIQLLNDDTYVSELSTQPGYTSVRWNDLHLVRLDLSTTDKQNTFVKWAEFFPPLFQIQNDFRMAGNEVDANICPRSENALGARCQPGCESLFTTGSLNAGPQSGESTWIGYGMPAIDQSGKFSPTDASDYCLAGTIQSSGRYRFEAPERMNWNERIGSDYDYNSRSASPHVKEQVRAAIRHFGSNFLNFTGAWNLAPALGLATYCLQDSSDFLIRTTEGNSRFRLEEESIKSLFENTSALQNFDTTTNATAPDAPKEGVDGSFRLSCGFRPAVCDLWAEDLFEIQVDDSQRIKHEVAPNRFNAFFEKCACQAQFQDKNGQIESGKRPGNSISWKSLCNFNARKTPDSSAVTCSNTAEFGDSGEFVAYKAYSEDFPDGLTDSQIQVCECMVQRYRNEDQLPNVVDWNFRSPISQSTQSATFMTSLINRGYSTTLDSADYSPISETLNNAIPITRSQGVVETLVGGKCDAEVCSAWGASQSCCTSRRPAISEVSPNFNEWSGFCTNECAIQTSTRDLIRRIITDTDANADLPRSCGGPIATGTDDEETYDRF